MVNLIRALNEDENLIKQHLSKPEFEATKDKLQRITEDPRVVDLQLDKGTVSPTAKFRKGLSQRSLAIEYTRWEICVHRSSRVGELVENSYLEGRNNGHITEYLDVNKDRFKNQQVTRTGIEHGIKLLVFERLLGTSGISAILSFRYRRFRMVKYQDLAFLKTMVNQSSWLATLVEQKADWLDNCQSCYDGMWLLAPLAPLTFLQCRVTAYQAIACVKNQTENAAV